MIIQQHTTREFKVRFFMDDEYEVVEITRFFENHIENDELLEEEKVYKGSLANCEAYIRLKEGNYFI
jgi:hypothetical protein